MPMPELDFGRLLKDYDGAVSDQVDVDRLAEMASKLKPLASHTPGGQKFALGEEIGNPIRQFGLRALKSAIRAPLDIPAAAISLASYPLEYGTDAINSLMGNDPKAMPNAWREPLGGLTAVNKAMDYAIPTELPTTNTERAAGTAGDWAGMMTSASGLTKAGLKLPLLTSSDTLRKALLTGAAGGVAADTVETATDNPLLGMAAGITGQIATHSLDPTKLASLMSNQTGAIPNPFAPGPSLWERTVGGKIQKVIDRIGDVELLGKRGLAPRVSEALGGSRPVDWVTAPVDRMTPEVGKMYSTAVTEAGRISQSFEDVSKGVLELNLPEREAFTKFLRDGMDVSKVDPVFRTKIASIIQPYEDAYSITKGRMMNRQQYDDLYKQDFTKRVETLLAHDMNDPHFNALKAFTPHDLNTSEGARKFLDEVINNPGAEQGVRRMAADLYNLPSKTLGEVANASRQSIYNQMYRKIAANPEWAKLTGTSQLLDEAVAKFPKPTNNDPKAIAKWNEDVQKYMKDFVHVKGAGPLGEYVVHKDVAEGINDLNQLESNFRRNFSAYALNPWKMGKAIMSPAARVRDVVNNMMFADIAGEHPLSPFRVDVYLDALKEIKNKGRMFNEFHKFAGVAPGNWSDLNMKEVTRALKHNASIIETLLSWTYNNKLSRTMINVAQFGDQWVKLAKFIHNRASGMKGAEAAQDAVKSVGDYNRQNRATRLVRDAAMPFFGFQMHALRTVGQGLVHRPIRTMKYLALPYLMQQAALSQLNLTRDDWEQIKETLPEYQKTNAFGLPTHVPVPVRDEKGRIQLLDAGWWIPGLQDMAELGGTMANPMKVIQTPAFNIPASFAMNKKFSGAPIYYDWDMPDVKAAKSFAFMAEQMLPSWTPLAGSAYKKAAKAFGEDPMDENLTPAQAAGSLVGYKVSPFYPEVQASKHWKGQEQKLNEAKGRLRHDMSRTTDEKDWDKMTDNYQRVVEKLYPVR